MDRASMVLALQALAAQIAVFQALLFAASAIHKASGWSRSKNVLRRFAGVPRSLDAASLGITLLGETAAAALLIGPAFRAAGAVLASVLWLSYLALIVRAILQNRRDVDCGCSFGLHARPLGAFQLIRNSTLVVLALAVAWISASSGSLSVQGTELLAGAALLAVYCAMDQVMALRPLRHGEIL